MLTWRCAHFSFARSALSKSLAAILEPMENVDIRSHVAASRQRRRRFVERLSCASYLALATGALVLSDGVAASGGWTLAGPANAQLETAALDISAPSVVVAGNRRQLFYSTDAGATWKFIAGVYGASYVGCGEGGAPTIVEVAGAQGEQVTAQLCPFIYFSPDGGESWGRIAGPAVNSQLIATNPTDQRQLYVSVAGGQSIFWSQDRGQTWFEVPLPSPTRIFHVDWPGGQVYCAVGGSVYAVGLWQPGPWRLLSTGLPQNVNSIAGGGSHLYAVTDSGVYVLPNPNGSWQLSLSGTVQMVALSTANSPFAYATQGRTLQKSVDGGQTWNPLPPLPGQPSVAGLVIGPSNPLQVLALTDQGLMQSSNGGQSFAPAATASQLPGQQSLGVVTNPSRPAELYVRSGNPAWSSDGGLSWTSPKSPAGVPLEPLWANGTLVFASDAYSLAPGLGQTLYRSADSGATWSPVLFYSDGTAQVFAEPDGKTFYLFKIFVLGQGAGYDVFTSTDSGVSWTALGHQFAIIGIIRQRPDSGEFFITFGGSVYRSTDGVNLVDVGAANGLPRYDISSLAIAPSSPSTMYVGLMLDTGAPNIYKSTDSGTTWSPVGAGPTRGLIAGAIAVDPESPTTVYAAFGFGVVYRSSDGGVTWANVSAGLYFPYATDLTFSLADPHRLYASTASGVFSVDTATALPIEAAAVEYYYAAFDHFFVTAFPAEIAALDGGLFNGWVRTGKTYPVEATAANGLNSVCRFFSVTFAPKSSHFYTPYTQECSGLIAGGVWQYEGVAFQLRLRGIDGSCPGGFNPYYRLYNNGQGGAPNHRYTDDLAVLNQMVAQGWSFEGDGRTKAFACIP